MADLYELANRFHDQIVARDAKATGALVRGYGQAWTEIRKRLDELEARRKAAGDAGLNWLFSRDAEAEEPEDRERSRLENLLREVEEQLRFFAAFADPLITGEQQQAVEAAQKHAAALVNAQVSAKADKPAGVRVSFQRLPKAALQELVGFTGDGTPLRALLDELGPSASESVRKHLVQGIGTGRGIKQTARLIKEDLGGDLVRALRISRTETLRAYRESSIRGFQANADVVEKWRWTASRSARTCAMCLAMDGQEFPVTEHFGSHVNCRCTPVPVVKSLAEIVGDPSIPDTRPKRDTGPEWFAKQPESTQLQILGPGKHAAYKAGKLKLEDLVGYREDPKWGPVRWERSLKHATSAGEQRQAAEQVKPTITLLSVQAGRQESGLDPRLHTLKPQVRQLWESAEARRTAFWQVIEAAERGDADAVALAVRPLEDAADHGLTALGYPIPAGRTTLASPKSKPLHAHPPRVVELEPQILRLRIQSSGADELWRAWLQETCHVRREMDPDYQREYDLAPGYEEGLAEAVAVLACKDRAGITVKGNATYRHYVRSYNMLAAELQREPEELFRELWKFPAGQVRDNLTQTVGALRGTELTREQADRISVLADHLFAPRDPRKAKEKLPEYSDEQLRERWREALE